MLYCLPKQCSLTFLSLGNFSASRNAAAAYEDEYISSCTRKAASCQLPQCFACFQTVLPDSRKWPTAIGVIINAPPLSLQSAAGSPLTHSGLESETF